ncbi:hypothetical protein CIG19_02450 [Enterobacterales bacterium CwR94]|nr:hypothetical protein CIG19_02450 [Enterobacterales bacterium CwR94]
MNDKKMISIDQFDAGERLAVDEAVNALMEKYRQRTGAEPDSKKQKAFTAEARQTVMVAKLAREKAKAEKAKRPVKKKKPEAMTASEVNDFNWSVSVTKGRRQ